MKFNVPKVLLYFIFQMNAKPLEKDSVMKMKTKLEIGQIRKKTGGSKSL